MEQVGTIIYHKSNASNGVAISLLCSESMSVFMVRMIMTYDKSLREYKMRGGRKTKEYATPLSTYS